MSDETQRLQDELVTTKAELKAVRAEIDKLWHEVYGLKQTKMDSGHLGTVLTQNYGVRRRPIPR